MTVARLKFEISFTRAMREYLAAEFERYIDCQRRGAYDVGHVKIFTRELGQARGI